ncbi:hypothetical protein ABKN59_000145 [Abortiporus biennis]
MFARCSSVVFLRDVPEKSTLDDVAPAASYKCTVSSTCSLSLSCPATLLFVTRIRARRHFLSFGRSQTMKPAAHPDYDDDLRRSTRVQSQW